MAPSSGETVSSRFALCVICTAVPDRREGRLAEIRSQSGKLITLERIIERKFIAGKFVSDGLCVGCDDDVAEAGRRLASWEEKKADIRAKFDAANPRKKRGRKKRKEPEKEREKPQKHNEKEVDGGGVGREKRRRRSKVLEDYVTVSVGGSSDDIVPGAYSSRLLRRPRPPSTTSAPSSSQASSCPHCDYVDDSSSRLERHVRSSHSVSDRPHLCSLCGKGFALRSSLASHAKTHTEEQPFSCDKCSRSFKQRNSLREHVLKHHDLVKQFTCGDGSCKERFSSRHLLKRHEVVSGHGKGGKPHLCGECGESFSTSQTLQYHTSQHTGDFRIFCSICRKGFNTKALLAEHENTHTGKKPYQCPICSKEFSNRGTFWAHKKQHADAKPYECEFCSRKFSHSSHLSTHRRSHTGEKPYSCRVCSESFSTMSFLRRHMKVHPADKYPFGCGHCGATFALITDLKKHCQQQHKGVVCMQRAPVGEEHEPKSESDGIVGDDDDVAVTATYALIDGKAYRVEDDGTLKLGSSGAENVIQVTVEDDPGCEREGELGGYTLVNVESVGDEDRNAEAGSSKEQEDEVEQVAVRVGDDLADDSDEEEELDPDGQSVFLIRMPDEAQG